MSIVNETDLMNQIRLALSAEGFAVFRANVGRVRLSDGRVFSTGLPNGHSDLVAYRGGRVCFLEVKVAPNQPSAAQLHFLDEMRTRYGCSGGVAYSVEDARRIANQIGETKGGAI